MKRLVGFSLAIIALTLSGCARLSVTPKAPAVPGGPPKVVWAGTSAGYKIRWTTGDITAVPAAKPSGQALSELGLTIYDFHRASHMQTGDCDFVRVTQLQSVVGSIVSILDNDTMKCANGATAANRKTVAVDLRHPASQALLTDYFPAHELSSLFLLAARACKMRPENLLNGFAFDQLHGNAVVVSVTLPSSCSQPDVSVALNVPSALKSPLLLAAARRQGFLLRDQATVSGGQTTTINYHYRTTSS